MTNFLKLPSELRNRIYELCLLHTEPLRPWSSYYEMVDTTPGLFRTNKIIQREACSFFYANNCFDFTEATPQDISLFLRTIGRNNVECIQHVRIDFPALRDLEPGNVTFEECDASILANIQSACTNLSTLRTCLSTTSDMILKLDELDYPRIVTEAFELINTTLRASPSLGEIVVEVFEDDLSNYIRKKMEALGWTIIAIEGEEDSWSNTSSRTVGLSWEQHLELDYEYDLDDSDDADSYDIDNDSDFWRRAAD